MDNELLYEFQSGFRSSHSTDTSLIHLLDYIKIQQDKGNYTGMVLLDLQKAFDTVDHHILMIKLKALGFDEPTIAWFQSYLNGRLQAVEIGGTLSTPASVLCGVPQGSILGPLLFLIYVNDMPLAVRCKLLLYADDSALIVTDKNITEIQQTLSSELESIRGWLIDNCLYTWEINPVRFKT
jgi:ribonuclease P/MRP protein subunit RPP40